MKSFQLCLVVVSSLLFSGCQSVHYYEGPPRTKPETAEVFVATDEALPVFVISINGKVEVFSYSKRIYLLPNEYTMLLISEPYKKVGSNDGYIYRGLFELQFRAAAGKTYTFKSTQGNNTMMNVNSRLCVYEEEQETPNSKANWTNEFRSPSDDATNIQCAQVNIQRIE